MMPSRRAALRGVTAAVLAMWLLREIQWLRRWRKYWRALQHQMRAPALTSSVSVPLDLAKLGLLSDESFVSVVRGLLLGAAPRRSPSFAAQLHRGLSYLADRRHPSRTDLTDTQPHIARAQSAASAATATGDSALSPDEPSVFAQGPAVLPLPWSVCAAAQSLRPLASAAALPCGDGWRASREAGGVSVLWREPCASQFGPGAAAAAAGAGEACSGTPWLLLHGIGGADRRCIGPKPKPTSSPTSSPAAAPNPTAAPSLTSRPSPSPSPSPSPTPAAAPWCVPPPPCLSPQVHRGLAARVPCA